MLSSLLACVKNRSKSLAFPRVTLVGILQIESLKQWDKFFLLIKSFLLETQNLGKVKLANWFPYEIGLDGKNLPISL